MEKDIEKRFLCDVRDHQMIISRDDSIDRHLRFKTPGESAYYFDLVKWNNVMVITGNMGS
jgi:hypothetical protein